MHTQVAIIGSGPAGYTAGIYTSRAGLRTYLITGNEIGGQLMLTDKVENFPGFSSISGLDLMDNFQEQAKNLGVQFINETVIQADLLNAPFKLTLKNKEEITADSVIIATGAQAKWLNIDGEEKFKGHGIGVCAICDGFFYRNKKVIVIGGGNSALYEAVYLGTLASEVIVLVRGEELKGEKILIEQLKANPKIKVFYQTAVIRFEGQEKLSGVLTKNLNDDSEKVIEADGAFVAIGHDPNSALFKGQLKINDKGYIETDKNLMTTSLDGVFACGDVQEENYRQAVVSSASGCIAGLSAERYLMKKEK